MAGGCDRLGHRSQIENGCGRHRRRVGCVGKASDAAPRGQLSAMDHGNCRAGEDALLDSLLEQRKSTSEDALLFGERIRRNQARAMACHSSAGLAQIRQYLFELGGSAATHQLIHHHFGA